ncbi:hypothetical protein QYM36_004217 [Artemia franciscana]|uniref:Uncharacterized protein n=1 Tax=Artemia franciscana TaxID=6661 RepID=A0AA88IG41_ARTSF|nr:hypothetical protein QYM36_004217 [Artemia franciscana]
MLIEAKKIFWADAYITRVTEHPKVTDNVSDMIRSFDLCDKKNISLTQYLIFEPDQVPYVPGETTSTLTRKAIPSPETTEKQVDSNVNCMEIIHALGVAESAAVAQRKVRIGTEVPRWKENPLLAQLCHASKFWHKIPIVIGKPRSGTVNTVQIYLKRKFVKCLQRHNATILDENSNTLKSDPNAVWNFLKRK